MLEIIVQLNPPVTLRINDAKEIKFWLGEKPVLHYARYVEFIMLAKLMS